MLLSTLPAAGAASLAAAPVVVSRNLALKKLDYKVPLQVGLLAATQLVLSLSLSRCPREDFTACQVSSARATLRPMRFGSFV
jgi:hypothetical protein